MTGDIDSLVAQKQMARIALAIVTMRVNTPAGDSFSDHFGDAFSQLAAEAVQIAGDDVAELLFLNMLGLASYFVGRLDSSTDLDAAHWLNERSLDIESW